MDKSRFFHSKRPQMNPSSTVLASCLILRHAYVFLERNQCFATGGFGPNEQLLPRDQLREKLGETHNTFETLCGSWATFKLAKYLISFTGDAQYGDWIERLVLNGIGAGIPMTADGRVFYYSDYNLHGGTKRNTDFGWSCCTGARPQAVADYTDLVYFRDAGTLYVNFSRPVQPRPDLRKRRGCAEKQVPGHRLVPQVRRPGKRDGNRGPPPVESRSLIRSIARGGSSCPARDPAEVGSSASWGKKATSGVRSGLPTR